MSGSTRLVSKKPALMAAPPAVALMPGLPAASVPVPRREDFRRWLTAQYNLELFFSCRFIDKLVKITDFTHCRAFDFLQRRAVKHTF